MKLSLLIATGLLIGLTAFGQTPCENGFAGIYPCENVDLVSHLVLAEIGCTDNTNDIWGWTSPVTAREYALVGCANGTSFVDITVPTSPEFIGFLPTHTVNSLWRDIKTYNNYAFIVAEAQGHGLQVFDLLQLDDVVNTPTTFVETEHYGLFGNAHNVAINPDLPFAYCIGSNTSNGGLHIVNISDPLNPTFAGDFSDDGYTHDCQNVIYAGPDTEHLGKEIVFAFNEDAVTVVDATDKLDCQMLDSRYYPETGYTHQGWLTTDQQYLLVGDELDEMDFGGGTRTLIFDVRDLDNVEYMGYFQSTSTAIDHNLYVIDHFVYQSNYRSGLRILDDIQVEDATLSQLGFFDLYPTNDLALFSGSWSNYSYFKSGNVIATSMYDGIFVLNPSLVELSQAVFELCAINEVSFDLTVNVELYFPLTASIAGLGASIVSASSIESTGTTTITISNLLTLAPGIYETNLELNATNGESYHFPLVFEVADNSPLAPALSSPAMDAQVNSSTLVSFEWEAQAEAISYTFELASDAGFGSIVESQIVAVNSFTLSGSLPLGVYFWRVRVNNSCGAGPFSSVSSFSIILVGVDEREQNSVTLYPNPASEEIMVSWKGSNTASLSVSDMTGRICFQQPIADYSSVVVDLRHFAPGIYQVRIGSEVMRFVKK